MPLITPIPLSLYIHLPWCTRKCPYCDFNSHVAPDNLPEELYVNRLIQNLEDNLPAIWGRKLVSIFFGGGTPSLFSPASIEKILLAVNARCQFVNAIEITLEANPGSVEEARFKDFHAAGINRLSIGLQSLQDDKLKALGRIHNREYALRAIDIAIQSGFTNFNVDLMHGLPNQSTAEATADLQDALSFEPPHVSWYQLTIEPNTLFAHQTPELPDEATLADIQQCGKSVLTAANLHQYEVSAYAKTDHACVHNTNYWQYGDYLGIGAGAHSKITDVATQTVKRHWVNKNPRDFLDIKKSCIAEEKVLTPSDLSFEFMLNALRLIEGVPSNLYTERTGLTLSDIQDKINLAQEKGLLHRDASRLQATELGQQFLDNLIQLFL
jgi:putative oxygen-independent coproporphyrinogen III oxidase